MSRKNRNTPPAGSDAEAAMNSDASALPPSQIGAADDNRDNTEEANARSAEEPELDEPGTVEELQGGAGALPHSLEPAAANARKAERVSELQAEIAKKPENPNAVLRKALKEVFDYVGKPDARDLLIRSYGVDKPEDVPVNYLSHALDTLHDAADQKKG